MKCIFIMRLWGGLRYHEHDLCGQDGIGIGRKNGVKKIEKKYCVCECSGGGVKEKVKGGGGG